MGSAHRIPLGALASITPGGSFPNPMPAIMQSPTQTVRYRSNTWSRRGSPGWVMSWTP